MKVILTILYYIESANEIKGSHIIFSYPRFSCGNCQFSIHDKEYLRENALRKTRRYGNEVS